MAWLNDVKSLFYIVVNLCKSKYSELCSRCFSVLKGKIELFDNPMLKASYAHFSISP